MDTSEARLFPLLLPLPVLVLGGLGPSCLDRQTGTDRPTFAPGDKLDWKHLDHTQSNRCLDLLSFLLFLFVVRVVERGWTRAVRSDLFSNGSLSVWCAAGTTEFEKRHTTEDPCPSSVNFMCRAGQRAPPQPQQIDHGSTHQPDPTFNLATQASRRSSQGKSTRAKACGRTAAKGGGESSSKNTTTQSLVGVCQSHARADQPGEASICLAWAVGHVGFQGHGPLACSF